jgi:Spy/CpxP family protein refolding chaperone
MTAHQKHNANRIVVEVVASFLLLVGTPVQIGSARWWHSPRIVHDLSLEARQIQAIDRLYRQSLLQSRARAVAAATARARFDRLLEMDASDETLMQAGCAVVDADVARSRARTLMLWRMYAVLTPTQRSQLKRLEIRRVAGNARFAFRENRVLPELLPW